MTTPKQRPTAASSFQLLWDNLSDLIGITATATLLRRAAKHAEQAQPALAGLIIKKPSFDYEFIVPDHWSENGSAELAVLVQTLQPLLVELTGLIVIQRLRSIPPLAAMLMEDDHER